MSKPQSPEKLTRILLSEAASQHLAGTGRRFFAIVSMEDHRGRFIIYLKPWPDQRAAEAQAVLLGTHRAVKIKTDLFDQSIPSNQQS